MRAQRRSKLILASKTIEAHKRERCNQIISVSHQPTANTEEQRYKHRFGMKNLRQIISIVYLVSAGRLGSVWADPIMIRHPPLIAVMAAAILMSPSSVLIADASGIFRDSSAKSLPELPLQAARAMGLRRGHLDEIYSLSSCTEANGRPRRCSVHIHDENGNPKTVDLRPHSVRSPEKFQVLVQKPSGQIVQADPGQETTYLGTDNDGHAVAASVVDDTITMTTFRSSGDTLHIEPIDGNGLPGLGSEKKYAVYTNKDVIERSDKVCGAMAVPGRKLGDDNEENIDEMHYHPFHHHGHLRGETHSNERRLASGPISIANLAVDADYEYYLDYGSAVSDRIENVINTVNIQYEWEVGITHSITTILVRTSVNQPYTSTDATTLLNQFRSEWNSNQAGVDRDVAQ